MINDIKRFIKRYKFNAEPMTKEKLRFRMDLFKEEYLETMDAYVNKDPEELVDGLIDTIVISIGTLELVGVDVKKAWQEVQRANMTKVVGVKPGREDSHGIDIIKPDGWKKPVHKGNHGNLKELFK